MMSKCAGCDQHNANIYDPDVDDMYCYDCHLEKQQEDECYCDDCYEEHNYMLNMMHAIHIADFLIDEEFDNED